MEFIFTFFCFCSEVSLLFLDFSAFYFTVFSFSTLCSSYCFLRPAIHRLATIVSEAVIYTGCDTPFQGPSLGRPILGASNHGYFALFANLRGFLIAGVRKTQETL